MSVSFYNILFLILVSSTCVLCGNLFKRKSEVVEEWDTLEGVMEHGIQSVLELFDQVEAGDGSMKMKEVYDLYEDDLCPTLKRYVLFQRVVPHLQSDPYTMPEFCSSFTSDVLQKTLNEYAYVKEPPADMSVRLAMCTLYHAKLANFGPDLGPDVVQQEQVISKK